MSWFSKKEDAPALPPMVDSSLPSGPPRPSQAAENIAENFRQYSQQLNMISDMCWEKCVVKKAQTELTIGEISCDDRCVLKYLATTTKVAETFQALMQNGAGAPTPGQAK